MSTEVFTLPFKLGDGGNMGVQPGARRVLVVDDDMLALDVVREMLSSVGHEVTATHNPQKVLELIWNEHFDVVLTDLGMPVVSGWAVARQVKAKNALTPVILLTGWGAQYEEADLSKYGVDLVLAKPLAIVAQPLIASAEPPDGVFFASLLSICNRLADQADDVALIW
jgi:CheY-like chemotaxis protein